MELCGEVHEQHSSEKIPKRCSITINDTYTHAVCSLCSSEICFVPFSQPDLPTGPQDLGTVFGALLPSVHLDSSLAPSARIAPVTPSNPCLEFVAVCRHVTGRTVALLWSQQHSLGATVCLCHNLESQTEHLAPSVLPSSASCVLDLSFTHFFPTQAKTLFSIVLVGCTLYEPVFYSFNATEKWRR